MPTSLPASSTIGIEPKLWRRKREITSLMGVSGRAETTLLVPTSITFFMYISL